MAHFEIQNLTFSFPQSTKKALQDVTFSVQQGEFILICGLSGSGKSTLLRHLKAELMPHGTRQGSITCPKDVGFVMQDPADRHRSGLARARLRPGKYRNGPDCYALARC